MQLVYPHSRAGLFSIYPREIFENLAQLCVIKYHANDIAHLNCLGAIEVC